MRAKIWLFGFATLFGSLPPSVRADERTDRYVEALRAAGFADLAIEYLQNQWEAKGTTPEEKANLEFEIAASLIAASDALDDLSKREQMLEDARQKFEEFSKKHPKHPKAPEALVQMATVDLQKGRLRVVQAQLPANAGRAIALAKEAREYFKKSAADYEKAQSQLQAAFKAMPVYISDDDAEGRAQRALKTQLFDQYIEARFQGALAQFYLADSYKTIEIPPADPADAAAVAAAKKEREEWDRAYKGALDKAKKGFEAIYTEHRRELVGLYAHLWMARCMAAQGEHRQAMGIFELLMEHENPDLARLQREVFYFQMLSFAARKEFGQVVNLAVPWLRNNGKFRLEPAYQGVQMELALAYVAQASSAAEEREKSRDYVEANTLFERLGSYSNAYTGLARREQLKISPFLSKAIGGRNFGQLFSLANAKLDLLKPELSADEQTKLLNESKALLQDALRAARESDDVDAVNDARLALAFVHLRLEEIYEAATLCEYVARMHPKSTAAPQAAFFGITAYAWGFEKSTDLAEKGIPAHPEVDADHLIQLADYLVQRWPSSKEVDDALATVGRLEMSLKNYGKATAAFDKVNPKSAKYAESLALSGGVFWDWYKTTSRDENADPKELEARRVNAMDRLSRASPLLHAALGGVMDRQAFLNDAMLGEVYFESGDDSKALSVLIPLADRLKAGSVAADIEPPLRIGVLTTALQCYVRQNKLNEADGLIELISAQQGQEETGNVTLVFISLAARLREQMARIKAAGDNAKLRQLADSFEKFLDRVSGREAGQTIQSLVYLADNFIELERYAKAIALLQKVIEHPEASDEGNRASVNRARLLLARSQAKLGDFDDARATIDALLRENMNAKDVIMERGEILDASGDLGESIKHWKWVVNRMKQGRPRPPEFYQAVDRLIETFLKVSGPDRDKRLKEGEYLANFLLQTDTNLPPEWRPTFEKHSAALKAVIGSN